MEKIHKTALAVLIIIIAAAAVFSLFLNILYGDLGGTLSLVKISDDKTGFYEIVEITDADFNRYHELRELFENIDESRGEFISVVSVSGKAIDEIKAKYSVERDSSGNYFYKALFWNGSYYDILVAVS